MPEIQYTIRNVPEELAVALKTRADSEQKTIEDLIREILQTAVESGNERKQYHDLDFLIGSWIEDPEFDAAMKDFEAISTSPRRNLTELSNA